MNKSSHLAPPHPSTHPKDSLTNVSKENELRILSVISQAPGESTRVTFRTTLSPSSIQLNSKQILSTGFG